MNGNENKGFVPDPDFDEWDGNYIGIENAPPLRYHLQKILHYMTEQHKKLDDLTKQEIEMFRIAGR